MIYKYKIPRSGSPTMTFIKEIKGMHTSGCNIDRLCIAGDKDVIYFGGEILYKYNLNNSSLYDPTAIEDVG